MDKIEKEVIKIISKYSGIEEKDIEPNSSIQDDLGLCGVDFYDTVEEVCLKFNINCKEFYPEDVNLPEYLDYRRSFLNPFYLFYSIFSDKPKDFPDFRVKDLIKAAKTKVLKSYKPKGSYYASKVITE